MRNRKPVSSLHLSKSGQPNQATKAPQQLSLLPQAEQAIGEPQRLQIASCPIAERDEDSIYRYIFKLLPSNIRACWARFSADEAHEICKIAADWDWRVNPDGKPNHRARLEHLIDRVLAEQASQHPSLEQGRVA